MAENQSVPARNPKWFESREKNPRVAIAISAFCPPPIPFVGSLIEVIRAAMFEGVVVDIRVDISKPLDLSRNLCVKNLLKNDPDYIFFMDSDMVFKPNTLVELLRQDKDIISGIYCYKMPPFSPVLSVLDENMHLYRITTYPRDKLFKVDGCGCGCLLVKRKVFDEMGPPWFKMSMAVSEDMYFGRMAAKKGFDIWADGSVECGHLSDCVPIEPGHFWMRRDKIKEDMEKRVQFNEGRTIEYKGYDGVTEERK